MDSAKARMMPRGSADKLRSTDRFPDGTGGDHKTPYAHVAEKISSDNVNDFDRSIADVNTLMLDLSLINAGDNTQDAVTYHFGAGGKRVRARLATHIGRSIDLCKDDYIPIAACAELLHNASLIHDDIQDHDTERRGKPSLWKAFGHDIALMVGDLFISSAYAALGQCAGRERLSQLISVTHQCISKTIKGQLIDRSFEKQPLHSLSQYDILAANKSGPLLALPYQLCLIQANMDDYIQLAEKICHDFAIAYQLVDDITDVDQDEKSFGHDAAPNIVLILERSHQLDRKKAYQQASDMAYMRMSSIKDDCTAFPSGMNDFLLQYLGRMSDTLKAYHHAKR